MMATERNRVVLTVKDKVNIVSRLKENEWGEKLAEENGVETATLWVFKISAELFFKVFFSVRASEDGSCTGQILRRAENSKVGDVVDKWFFAKPFTRPTTFWHSCL